MAKLRFIRAASGLVPGDAEAAEWLLKVTPGKAVHATMSVPRNDKFHAKFFAMLNTAYANREWPEVQTQYGPARTSFEMFRKYVTVRAGFYEPDLTPKGEIRVQPKSIKFGKMDEEEFGRLYSAVLDVILAEFLTNWTAGDMDVAVDQMLGFA